MQWLDDLDDLVVAIVHVVERLHWRCLKIGFAAACALVVVSLANAVGIWIPALTWTALGGLGLGATGNGVRELARRSGSDPRPSVSPNA